MYFPFEVFTARRSQLRRRQQDTVNCWHTGNAILIAEDCKLQVLLATLGLTLIVDASTRILVKTVEAMTSIRFHVFPNFSRMVREE